MVKVIINKISVLLLIVDSQSLSLNIIFSSNFGVYSLSVTLHLPSELYVLLICDNQLDSN